MNKLAHVAQKAINDKATRASFKLRSLLQNSQLNLSTCLKLFDQLIKPICLYGSEIWGVNFIKTSDSNKTTLSTSFDKLRCEKLNLSFCKTILGVHRKAQNSAVRGELGRSPLGIDIYSNILKYNEYLKTKDRKSLLGEALLTNHNLKGNRKCNWSQKCSKLISYIQSLLKCNVTDLNNRKLTNFYLRQDFISTWKEKILKEPKMRLYNKIKSKFIMEEYLNLNNDKHRIAITKLRISAHSLAIEKGRYTRPPMPVNDRICNNCKKVEDEIHFLIECKNFDNKRNNFFKNIITNCPNFVNLENENKLIYLLTAGIDLIKLVGQFIHENL